MSKKKSPIIPPDLGTCQAEKPNGHSFMTLGGSLGKLERCTEEPSILIVEKSAGKDGKRGSMSLCKDCFEVFKKQMPDADVVVWEKSACLRTTKCIGIFRGKPCEKSARPFSNYCSDCVKERS